MNNRSIKTWLIFLVIVVVPTVWVLLQSPQQKSSASPAVEGSLTLSNSVSHFTWDEDRAITIQVDEFIITENKSLFANGLTIESKSPLIPSFLSVNGQSKSLFCSLTQQFNRDMAEESKPQNDSVWKYQELEFNDLTVNTLDIQAKAEKLTISPGNIGPFRTALYTEVFARKLRLAIEAGGKTHDFQADSASWRFPIGEINLGKGIVQTNDNVEPFQRCILNVSDWSVSDMIHEKQPERHHLSHRKYIGLQCRLFSL